jgi:aflatoxin B1 aldehyde reductase
MDTKFFPNVHGWMGRPETHLDPEGMRNGLADSLKALGSDKVDLWYLHAPDRSVPIEETLRGVNELHKQGKFKRWGVSNFMAWEGSSSLHLPLHILILTYNAKTVATICEICRSNSYPLPSVYQGVYNALHRTIEAELLPCLRHYNMSFYAFNPLAVTPATRPSSPDRASTRTKRRARCTVRGTGTKSSLVRLTS